MISFIIMLYECVIMMSIVIVIIAELAPVGRDGGSGMGLFIRVGYLSADEGEKQIAPIKLEQNYGNKSPKRQASVHHQQKQREMLLS